MVELLFMVEKKEDPIKAELEKLASSKGSWKLPASLPKLEALIEFIKRLEAYRSLSYISSGSFMHLYITLRRNSIELDKIDVETRADLKYMICYAVANEYALAVERENVVYIARSPLGDLLVEAVGNEKNPVKKAIAFIIGGLLVPSRTSLLYILMNSARTDNIIELASHIKGKLFTHLFFYYRRLPIDTLLEIYDTAHLGKLIHEEYVRRERHLFTPSHAGYTIAKAVDELIDFETYKPVVLYATGGRGFVQEDALRRAFEDIRVPPARAPKLIAEHPVLSLVSDFIEKIKQRYSELDYEIKKLTDI